jgi:hypothetical protein
VNIKHKPFKQALLFAVLLIYLVPVVFSVVRPTQRALAKAPTLQQKTAAYGAGSALFECADVGNVNWKTGAPWSDYDYSLAEISSGDIWEKVIAPSVVSFAGKPAGFLVDSNDGITDCINNGDVLLLFKGIGIDGNKIGEYLIDLGILELSDNKAGYNMTGKEDAEMAKLIKKKIEADFGIDLDKPMPDDMAYTALSLAFAKGCDPQASSIGTPVAIVDAKGEITNPTYLLPVTDSVSAGYGLPFDQGDDGELACTTIVKGMNQTAQGYSTAAKAVAGTDAQLPGASAPGGAGGGSTADKATCESTGWNPLSWLMCAVFNMFADATEWFYTSILQPFLYTPPVDTRAGTPSFKVWSNFRILGNIFLIIVMLVVVFGQTIGGGLIDAYTAKKIMPRILTAAIFINLSVYIVALMVDLTNVAGDGIARLLLSPFDGMAGFNLSGSAQGAGGSLVVLGGLVAAGGIAGFLTASAGAIAPMIAFTVVIPAFLAMLGVFVTLIVRRGLILALILTSPVAFALYCLPNTEKYFKKWWELLFTSLLIYPIVMSIFAISSIMSMMVLDANQQTASGGVISGGLAGIVAFSLQIIPLFLVPYAFKLSGGALANLNNTLTGGSSKINAALKGRKDQAAHRYNTESLQGRQNLYQRGQDMASSTNRFKRVGGKLLANRVGGYNIEAATSEARAANMKLLNDQIATGRDDEIRGLTVNKKHALKNGTQAVKNAAGEWSDGDWREKDGIREFKSLGGAWVKEADVDAGHTRWGNDTFAQQAALSYEMRKASGGSDQDRERVVSNFHSTVDSWGISEQQKQGIWKGSGFENQNASLMYKHTKQSTDANGVQTTSFDHKGFMNEIYEKKGTYPMAQMDATTISRMTEAADLAKKTGDMDLLGKSQSIAETMQDRMRPASGGTASNDPRMMGEDGKPVGGPIGAPGHVQDAMNEFVTAAFDNGASRVPRDHVQGPLNPGP